MSRGFSAVGLWNPKYDGNVGGTIRSAGLFDCRLVVIGGHRLKINGRIERTDTRKAHRHVPVVWSENPLDAIPHESTVVAIEMSKHSKCLTTFEHPESAFYLFGSEDGGIPRNVQDICDHVISIPVGSINLASAVSIVLYDRMMKSLRS